MAPSDRTEIAAPTPAPVLAVEGLTKLYPGVVALDGVDLQLYAGRAHALVGENGAGKSTLIKMLAGAIRPDGGTIQLRGAPTRLASPTAARKAGIAVVHQHNHLIPDLTLAENFALREGYPRNAMGLVAWPALRAAAEEAIHVMIPGLDVTRRASSLSGVEKQMVEISFALAGSPAVLILDEPTAILPHAESDRLFRMVRVFLARGGSVLFVSHRLDEVFALCDHATVLRDGRRVWTKPTSETNSDDLIQAMVGRGVSFERDPSLVASTEPLLEVDAFSDDGGAFSDAKFTVHRGEILGVYGLVGAGQAELCAALLGLRKATGHITLTGNADGADTTELAGKSAGHRVRRGLGLVPAERLERGMFRQMSVGENMSIASLKRKSLLGLVRTGAEQRENQRLFQELRVRATGLHQNAVQLSGGNQQKVLLARWLQTRPRVLILEEPTQGVDVGAKVEIHKLIRDLARTGVGVLLVSSEMPELLSLSHRVAIMRQGRLVAEMDGESATEEAVLKLALPPQENLPPEELEATVSGDHTAPPPTVRGVRKPRKTRRRELGLLVLLVAIVAAAALFVPNFATADNFRDILKNQSILLLGALGVGAVIIAGGIDISIGAILGLAALAAARADLGGEIFGITIQPQPRAVVWLAPLVVGGALGAINGLLTVFGRVHSIVITLGMMFILQGLMLEIMANRWIFNLSDRLTSLGRGAGLAGVPNLILFGAGGAAVTALLLGYLVTGRRWYAVGGDAASAQLLGVSAKKTLPLAFTFSGFMAGLAGLLHAGYYGQVQTTAGRGYELQAIAAAVIGGVHIMGGRGSAVGILLGALLLGVIRNLLVFLQISAFWDNAITGAVILAAVCADALGTRRERAEI